MKKILIWNLILILSVLGNIHILQAQVDTITTTSGMQYVITEKGNGQRPQSGDKVVVHYTGKLTDGSVFDSSVEKGKPFSFTLGAGQVIKGWDEGIALLQIGDKATFTIPPELGYGKKGSPPVIPRNATLIFDVELIDVIDNVDVIDNTTGKHIYKAVNEVKGAYKKELYTRAKLWMITSLVSGVNPLNYYNEEAGVIIANGNFYINYTISGASNWDKMTINVKYIIKVSVKDRKYKYEIEHFIWKIVSWTFKDEHGHIKPINPETFNLDEKWPTVYGDFYSQKVKNKALNDFYLEIDKKVIKKITSLKVAMREGVDDDW